MKKAQAKPATELVNDATPVTSVVSTTRIVKVGSCPTLSGKSNLTYHIGVTQEGDIKLRVHANTGSGYFSNEWVAIKGILDVLAKVPKKEPITSYLLVPLLIGKSINTPPFLFAALLNEGLVARSVANPRCYEVVDSKAFMSRMKALLDAKVEPEKVNAEVKPKKVPRKKAMPETA